MLHADILTLTPESGSIRLECAEHAPTVQEEGSYTVSPGNSLIVYGNAAGIKKLRVIPLEVGKSVETRCYYGYESSQGTEEYTFEPNEGFQFVHPHDTTEAKASRNLNATRGEDAMDENQNADTVPYTGNNDPYNQTRRNYNLNGPFPPPISNEKKLNIQMKENANIPFMTEEGGKRKKKTARASSALMKKNRSARTTRRSSSRQEGGKRKMNPFMKFANQERKNVMAKHPTFAIPEIGKELGKRWRALSEAEKKRYA